MTKDLTNGSPMKLVLGFSIPLLLGFLFQQFYSLVDTLIVGRYLGVDPLAAVGSTSSVASAWESASASPSRFPTNSGQATMPECGNT